MLKKLLIVFLSFCGVGFCSEETINFPFYKETEHFQAYCLKDDAVATEEVLQDLESFYNKICLDFNYMPTSFKKIRFDLYPDIQTFHATLHEQNLTQWKIANVLFKDRRISLVNPKNPGTVHTEETAMKCGRYALGYFLTLEKYPASSLQWTSLGLATYMSKVYSIEVIRQNIADSNGRIILPSFSQIDEQLANREFTARSYPIAACLYAEFLVTNWGWDKTLAILEDYSAFESILQVSQEEFQKMCVQSWQERFLDEK